MDKYYLCLTCANTCTCQYMHVYDGENGGENGQRMGDQENDPQQLYSMSID